MKILNRKLRKLRTDERGGAMILFGAAAPAVLGFIGLCTDVALWYYKARQLQMANDYAAISLAAERASSGMTQSDLSSYGKWLLDNSLPASIDTQAVTAQNPPLSGAMAGETGAVELTSQTQSGAYFSQIFGYTSFPIRARSVAFASKEDPACIIGLDTVASGTVGLTGGSSLDIDCGVASNSSDAAAFALSTGAYGRFSSLKSVGGNDLRGTLVLPAGVEPVANGAASSDPFRNVPFPTFTAGKCDYKAYSDNKAKTLKPGVYCDGLKLSSAKFTMDPGVYIIDRGDFNIGAGAQVSGTGVSIYFTDSTTTQRKGAGFINIQSNSVVTLSAPTTGDMMLFMVDPNANVSGTGGHVLSTASGEFLGNIYLPSGTITLTGKARFALNCVKIAAKYISLGGSFSGSGRCPYQSTSTAGTDAKTIAYIVE